MFTKLTHITLFVTNQDEALKFYTAIGFIVHTDAQFGSMRWLTLCLPEQPELELALILAETAEEKSLVGKQGAAKPFISLASNDCQYDYDKLTKQGIVFTEKPTEQPWGIAAALHDLYGNTIYICQSK
ncbi:VOC family protein [Candidatus Dependentiae bacterium]|nr:VOC family protein [Candidatus Dependentiae bacterium]